MTKHLITLISVLAFAPIANSGENNFNIRALDCQPMEFSEMNSMDKSELESLYCGYVASNYMSKKFTDEQSEKDRDKPDVVLYLASKRVVDLKKCQAAESKAVDLFARKFKSDKLDCSKFKGFGSDGKPNFN